MTPKAELRTIDLDETGWLLDGPQGRAIMPGALRGYLADRLTPPSWATDILVYIHGWQTSPQSAARSAERLTALSRSRFTAAPSHYPRLGETNFRPWTVAVRWPSASMVNLTGYRRIRERAHQMGSQSGNGHAAHVIGTLLGYLDTERATPIQAPTLANRNGQYLHLIGHSFGCRLACEAITWAAEAADGVTLGWSSSSRRSGRPFAIDSMLLFQMAAPHSAFETMFPSLVPGRGKSDPPLHGPIVTTHSRYDRATGFWHLRVEGQAGIGHNGLHLSDTFVSRITMRPVGIGYTAQDLDHAFVDVDASQTYRAGRILKPAGSHSDHLRAESAHLLVSLADLSR